MKRVMGIIMAMALILAGYLVSGTAWAMEVCPTVPFETDVRVAAAIASHPLRPRVWDASRTFDAAAGEMTDGASWLSAGGLMNYGSVQLSYDAKRYVVVHVLGRWPPRGMRPEENDDRQLSNQVVRRSGNATYAANSRAGQAVRVPGESVGRESAAAAARRRERRKK